MKEKNDLKWVNYTLVALVLVLAIAIFTIMGSMSGDRTFQIIDSEDVNTLELSETAKTEVEPDEATVNLRIVSRDQSHETAVNENTEINNRIIEHFEDDYEVVSRSYRVSEWTDYDPETRERQVRGYEVYNQIEITTKELDDVGKIISEAFGLGANEVQSVNYGLTDEEKKRIQDELINEAIVSLETRANSIAQTAGVEIKGIVKITPGSWDYAPMTVRSDMLMAEEAADGGYQQPDFSPGKEEVTSRVTIVYRIG